MIAADVMYLLSRRYSTGQGWAFLEQVPPGTGADGGRYADAIAMGLWRATKREVVGFEVKVSRGDWLRELKDPTKADAVKQFCDRWYLVVSDEAIVRPGELPAGWGMLAARQATNAVRGKIVHELVTVVPAPRLTPAPLDRSFIAAVLRRGAEAYSADVRLHAEYEAGARRIEGLVGRLVSILGYHTASSEISELQAKLHRFIPGAYEEARTRVRAIREELEQAAAAHDAEEPIS